MKKGVTIFNAFSKFFKKPNRHVAKSKERKPNKIWVNKDREYYNRSILIIARKK